MKRLLLTCLFLAGLLLPAGLYAADEVRLQEEPTRMQLMLENYKQKGYEIEGPVQYLGRNQNKIELFRRPPVSYTTINIIDPQGRPCFVDRQDFVFVLKNGEQVVLIRMERKDRDND